MRYLYMLFFFFKQKTAYEMRISDWVQTCALPICRVAGLERAIGIDDLRIDPEERPDRAAGFERVRARQRGDHVPAGLGLPPGIDDRAAPLPNHIVIPAPRLGVDLFAHRAQHFGLFPRSLGCEFVPFRPQPPQPPTK